ncbi:MAG: heavy-metal-associated domain-containing protein [Tissierellia bacterium]|nr:heavy-metal-associated domain-containing protein [Tissierellia bacterium]
MKTIKIPEMMCNHCVESITKALESLQGTENVEVNLNKKEAYYEGNADDESIKKAIDGIGFEVESIR